MSNPDALLALFQGVFQSSTDPSVELLSFIKSNPTTECSEVLAESILHHVVAYPRQVDTLVMAIKKLEDALQTQAIAITDEDTEDTFNDDFGWRLAEFLNDKLHETQLHVPKQTMITATNSVLSAALFSASAAKTRLIINHPGVYAFARQGLQLPDAVREPLRDEVVAIGTCLQLAVAGATMMEQWLESSDGLKAVLQALKGLKERGIITSSTGVCLLDKTIVIAEGNFSQDMSTVEAWDTLFSTT